MNWLFKWSLLRIMIFIFSKCYIMKLTLATEDSFFSRLIVASSHTALSGDLAVVILNLSALDRSKVHTHVTEISATTTEEADIIMEEEEQVEEEEKLDENNDNKNVKEDNNKNEYNSWKLMEKHDPIVLRVLRLDGFSSELIGEIPISTSSENVSLTIPCGYFSRGGAYSLQLQHSSVPTSTKFMDTNGVQIRTTLDVRWPTPSLTLEPQHFSTYPDEPVFATLEYTGISCQPEKNIPVDTYTLQLIYCGASVLSCDPRNKSNAQMLYSEKISGFPVQKILSLRCEFFGLAGHYALRLKPTDANSTAPTTSAYIKVQVSNQYVFNVHARSVYPCDGSSGGLSVLFQYPSCRLEEDRVRVYGRLRADVASLAPPSTLHYVAELKAPPGKHTLTFDCEIFTEKFVEYCFVYVSQAINNAMAEVRVDCIPTFPIQDNNAGGWGDWSPWGPCSSTCVGGVRNRYRFCDKPPPKYGAKFCQGNAVESEPCGGVNNIDLKSSWTSSDWECYHGQGLAAERPEVTAEIGFMCRCGCVIKLKNETLRKILAASTQACPGRSFWLIQTEPKSIIKLHFDQIKFTCNGQYVRARDGDSLSAQLIADIALNKNIPESKTIISTEQSLLLEFFSDEMVVAKAACNGGFLAHASLVFKPQRGNISETTAVLIGPKIIAAAGRWALWLSPAHLAAASLLFLMFLVSIFLALQYAVKYRKYQVAEDLDSLTDNSVCSDSMQGLAKRARALSSTTLISEVVSLVRLPRRRSSGHGRLEETPADVEDGYESTETQAEIEQEPSLECNIILNKQKEMEKSCFQKTIVASQHNISSTSSSITSGQPEVKYARPVKLRTVGPISPVSEEASISEESRRCSTTSGSISVNNVSVSHPKPPTLQYKGFSPASTSSNISSLRCGKETKDRRNRERLLQGHGSEFSLVNPDTDLELDYYDYNVVNAGAAPGSYLGMDPAFLVWIPPLTPGDTEILESIKEDHHYEEISSKQCQLEDKIIIVDNDGGTSLTPSEYQKLKSSVSTKLEQTSNNNYSMGSLDNEIYPKKIVLGESKLHDEIIMEYRARLHDGMLPIHRILEESRIRVSEESLTRHIQDDIPQIDVIPNRLNRETNETFIPKVNRDKLYVIETSMEEEKFINNSNINKNDDNLGGEEEEEEEEDKKKIKSAASVRNRLQQYIDINNKNYNSTPEISDIPNTSYIKKKRRHSNRNISAGISTSNERNICELKNESISKSKIPINPYLNFNKDNIGQLNNINKSDETIPLKEFGRNAYESPARVHNKIKESKNLLAEKEIQSPDYGVETDIPKDSIYHFIGEKEDGFKFADDDEDEYIYNKITV